MAGECGPQGQQQEAGCSDSAEPSGERYQGSSGMLKHASEQELPRQLKDGGTKLQGPAVRF